jgi:UDP-N-acetylmuramate dehydrogenase
VNLKRAINNIQLIEDVDLKESVNLSRFTTIRLEANGTIAIVKTVTALKEVIATLTKLDVSYHVLGWGSNQILVNTNETIFINLKFEFNRSLLNSVRDEYRLPASTPLNILTSHAQKFGLIGWEVFTGIPASIGGAVYMNAGTGLGEIGFLVKEVTLLRPDGTIVVLPKEKLNFTYRKNHFVGTGEIIIEVVLENLGTDHEIGDKIKNYLQYRKTTQPLASKNCGCVFKNFDSNHRAGHFVDLVGLKGLEINGLGVSHQHANFFENTQNATGDDFCKLVNLLQEELLLQTGIKFELEAKVY